MSKRKKIVVSICCVAAAGVVGLGAYRIVSRGETAPVSAQPSQVIVQAQLPQSGEISHSTEFIGTVEPDEVVTVTPKVSGTVLKTYFEVGDTVKKGDLLYELDPVDIQLSLTAAEAQLEANRISAEVGLGSGYDAQIIQAKSSLDAAQKAYNTARANLKDWDDANDDSLRMLEKEITKLETAIKSETDKDKLEELEKQLSLAKANYNERDDDDDPNHRALRTAFTNAQISYNAAKDAYDLVVGQARSDAELTTDASLKAAEAGLAAQQKQLEYTKVYSPIDGVIEQKNVTEHQVSGAGSPVYYTVSNKTLMVVKFSVSETAVQNIEPGDKVVMEKSGQTFDGTVTEVATMADPASGLFVVKAAVDADDIPLHTGSTVKISAQTEKSPDAILVPLDSVYYDEGEAYVYTYVDGVAKRTPVTTGISNKEVIEITSGLTSDDQVITTWHPKLLDGAAVVLDGQADAAPAESSQAADAQSAPEESSGEPASSGQPDAQ
ncbi:MULTISPECIES: efflux RND transporter periplasmic adaptor subunit [Anaerotruncus]|uniref:efflux RND transporter periplasmic adaptor subunit n=1 Tax=Anaerotruncus TaxID=244127 RepID=UPI0011C22C14|nr:MULTISPECIES: efflux RND transporter periplasmic adaptor subunit [Anaerotruncus]